VHPEAEELLSFYVILASWQRTVAEALDHDLPAAAKNDEALNPRDQQPFPGMQALEEGLLEPYLQGFVDVLSQGPAVLSALAAVLRDEPPLAERLARAFASGAAPATASEAGLPGDVAAFAGQAIWQPVLELLSARAGNLLDIDNWYEAACPFCGGPPLCSSLEGAGSRSGQRLLVCALCLFRWPVARLKCPTCGAQDEGVFSPVEAEQYPGLRLDVCARCRGYIKTADCRQDGRIVAEVDDLATPALDLWAAAQGLHRQMPALLH